MKICIINGSPKLKESNSKILSDNLIELLGKNEIKTYYSSSFKFTVENESYINTCKALIFVFPLYVDSIPSSLLEMLVKLEERKTINSETKIYSIVNNGFFEGRQNHVAISQLKIWSRKVNAKWGQGIGVGSGEMLSFLKNVPLGRGPLKNLGKAMNVLADNILSLNSGNDIYINPNWPKLLWWLQGTFSWFVRARKYGVKAIELFRRI